MFFDGLHLMMSATVNKASELEKYAKANLPQKCYRYFAKGAGDETTLKENTEAFKRFAAFIMFHYVHMATWPTVVIYCDLYLP